MTFLEAKIKVWKKNFYGQQNESLIRQALLLWPVDPVQLCTVSENTVHTLFSDHR